tara:strand:+ start:316 stop:888 length:573 start_codon:yes stop_codon:yes gene_type:complete
VSKSRFPIGIALSSVFVSIIIFSWQMGFAFVEPEAEGFPPIIIYILVGYLIYLLRYFVVNEGRKYTVSAFSTSVILSTVGVGMYDQQVGGWFWNDDWVMEEALITTIRPVIILFLLNEFFGLSARAGNRTANAGQKYLTSLIRIGLIASLPLVVLNPPLAIGTIIFIPTLILFFIFYGASTDTPLSLNGN